MTGGDPGSIGHRLPPERAPAGDVPAPTVSQGGGDLLELAWGVIANAGGGDWTTQTEEWQEAAARWRDRYHAALEHPESATSPVPPELVLVYVGETHTLHKEGCVLAEGTIQRIRESRLGRVSPDAFIDPGCLSGAEARIVRAGIQRA